jgi:hypothetical protein
LNCPLPAGFEVPGDTAKDAKYAKEEKMFNHKGHKDRKDWARADLN